MGVAATPQPVVDWIRRRGCRRIMRSAAPRWPWCSATPHVATPSLPSPHAQLLARRPAVRRDDPRGHDWDGAGVGVGGSAPPGPGVAYSGAETTMTEPARKLRHTFAEYLEQERASDTKHELINGEIF